MRKLIGLIFTFLILAIFTDSVHAYDPVLVPNNIYGIGIINHTDLKDVSDLVNVNGGDWGYVTIVITEDQMERTVWQKFFDECRRLHLIPIVRVSTRFNSDITSLSYGTWEIPSVEKIDGWVNFFNSLNWVVENRYVVILNEPNHAKEWGGKIDPTGYATYLKTFSERLKNSSPDYFVLNAGLDQSALNTRVSMDQKLFMDKMVKAVPDVFNFIDGLSSHSYPNPAFSGVPNATGRKSIKGYDWELGLIKSYGVKKELPVFITETGWVRTSKNEKIVTDKLKYAFENVWSKDKRVVAVTPFILNYQDEPFYEFSWKNKDGSYFQMYKEIQNLPKVKGEPVQKINGEVLFTFLNPLATSFDQKKGYALVRNVGQSIWNKQDIKLSVSNNNFEVKDIELNSLSPISSGLLVYTLKFPEIPDFYELNIGFYVNNQKIGDVYNGKIITFP